VPRWLKDDVIGNPHHGMPVVAADRGPQRGTAQAAIGEGNPPHARGDSGDEQGKRVLEMGEPCLLLVGGQHVPGDGNGGAAIEDADHEGDDAVVQGGVSSARASASPRHRRNSPRSRGAKQASTAHCVCRGGACPPRRRAVVRTAHADWCACRPGRGRRAPRERGLDGARAASAERHRFVHTVPRSGGGRG